MLRPRPRNGSTVKTRPIDIILLVALVAVSGAIVWTLFSLGGGSASTPEGDASPPADSPPSVTLPGEDPGNGGEEGAGDDGDGGSVVPIAPGEDGGNGDGEAGSGAGASGDAAEVETDETDDAPGDGAEDEDSATTDADATSDAAADEGGEAETDGEDADADEQEQAETDPPEPVPEGVVELERVGFSYVTGGAGACEIVLEPWEHVAVSRELLAEYGCGAEVTVELADETDGRSQVQAVVADTMNPSFSRTVNVYVGEDEPALDYGLTTGTIEPVE